MSSHAESEKGRNALPQTVPRGAGAVVLCIAVVPKRLQIEKGDCIQFPLYWLDFQKETIERTALAGVLHETLVDPLLEELWLALPDERELWVDNWRKAGFGSFAEIQFLPGVTDNLGRTVQEALSMEGLEEGLSVASGRALLFPSAGRYRSREDIERFCRYRYYHPLVERLQIHILEERLKERPERFLSFPSIGLPSVPPPETIDLDLDDASLERLSRERVLALTVNEMQAIKAYFARADVSEARRAKGLPMGPTDVELEIIAQTWSEHCKHKIFNARITHTERRIDGESETKEIDGVYKSFIKAATQKLKPQCPDLLSVFEDNAGVVQWNDEWAVCFKVETHNSPSALEPYGGALTGILGVNRDILGTGLGAKPIFNTDIFCFPHPDFALVQRPSMLPPEALIEGVRRGVQDGGNKSGIPTVNGAVYFHENYRAKPLVFCGTGGLLPLEVQGVAGYKKHTFAGDTIVMAGGRVGKDGIHGATFSSEALHEGSPVSAVQIGDPFTQKRLLDFVLEARDAGLISGITDNGAGGLSSSVGEMALATNGAVLELDDIPLKYPGLADWEIVVSESQERMTIATRDLESLQRLAQHHHVEVTAVGTFLSHGYFEVRRHQKPVALLDLEFLHNGAPRLTLESEWCAPTLQSNVSDVPQDLGDVLLRLLAHPNICSREAIIRQYDHEVQGASVVKPLMGPMQKAPCDAAVLRPLLEDDNALAVSNGICPQLSEYDTYLMAVCAADEAVRNAVCVGADPEQISLLDNFCWPDPIESERNPDGKYKLGQLVRACQGLYDAATTYGTPLISGKDSMKNDFDDGTVRLSIPPTLLISAIGRVPSGLQVTTMEFKRAGDLIYLLRAGAVALAGSQYLVLQGWSSPMMPALNLKMSCQMYRNLHAAMGYGFVRSAHDLSEGGLAVALAESVIGSGLGAEVEMAAVVRSAMTEAPDQDRYQHLRSRLDVALFGEGPAAILVTVKPEHKREWEEMWQGFSCVEIGVVIRSGRLRFRNDDGQTVAELDCDQLRAAWQAPLPVEGGRIE